MDGWMIDSTVGPLQLWSSKKRRIISVDDDLTGFGVRVPRSVFGFLDLSLGGFVW